MRFWKFTNKRTENRKGHKGDQINIRQMCFPLCNVNLTAKYLTWLALALQPIC